ncbi:hypothetical protein COX08_02450 [Candidatus Beckwithbacteria bacterium CG23_combo_of_CG06-09_8_20_14_all_34_8]|uniref:Uncharacterized protein n=2 Tax=Bacteria candidate phyla TaxID=1783234 RepID=A0A2H0B6D0_9BACT|nr:MAG: hypothetical protein COX08_02450 [Candidatus Beckwithbacteria bacterium CG23_combo_of_CG06-09_8_20_14_all_34_8]
MASEVTEIAVAIAQPLKVETGQILEYLKVHIGDVVTKQTVLAVKKGLFGLGGMELKSPVEGIVHNIDLENGVLIINLGSEKSILPAIANQKKEIITINPKPEKKYPTTTKYKRTAASQYETIEAIFGCGVAKGNGWLVEYNFDSNSILPEMEERIILATSMPTLAMIYKASAIGVAGIVVASKQVDAKFLQSVKQDLQGKSHLGFLVLPATTNLTTLHGVLIEIDGENKKLFVDKK